MRGGGQDVCPGGDRRVSFVEMSEPTGVASKGIHHIGGQTPADCCPSSGANGPGKVGLGVVLGARVLLNDRTC